MDDETRPDAETTDRNLSGDLGDPNLPIKTQASDHEDALPALDADDDPDSLAGDLTDPDVDVELVTEPDEDGGDEE